MNIYITAENQRQLRMIDGSMSGLVNELLSQHFGLSSNGRTEGFEPSYLGSSPSEPAKRVGYSNLFPSEVSSDVRPDIKIASEGKPWNSTGVDMTPACCLNKKPCKHWSWDGVNSQYVNSITGEIKPVEV